MAVELSILIRWDSVLLLRPRNSSTFQYQYSSETSQYFYQHTTIFVLLHSKKKPVFLLGYLAQQHFFSIFQDEEMKVPTYVGGVCTYVWVCMEVRGQP